LRPILWVRDSLPAEVRWPSPACKGGGASRQASAASLSLAVLRDHGGVARRWGPGSSRVLGPLSTPWGSR